MLAAVLVVIVGCADGRKAVVSVVSAARESVEAWSGVLRDLRDRGLRVPRLVIADGGSGVRCGMCGPKRTSNGAGRSPPQSAGLRWGRRGILNVLDQAAKT